MSDLNTSENDALNDAVPPDPQGSAASPQRLPAREQTVSPAHRPGWQTTEFWVSVLTIIAMLAGNLQGLPPKYAGIAASVVASCYALSRAITKLGVSLFP